MEDALEMGQWITTAPGWQAWGGEGRRDQAAAKDERKKRQQEKTYSQLPCTQSHAWLVACYDVNTSMGKQMNRRFGPRGKLKSLTLRTGRQGCPLWAASPKIPPSELPQPPCMPVQPKGRSQIGAGNNLENSKARGNFSVDFSRLSIRPWAKNLRVWYQILFRLQRERGESGRKMVKIGGEAASHFFLFCKASAVSQTSRYRGKGRQKGPNHYMKAKFAVLRWGKPALCEIAFLICRRTKPS